MESILFVLMAIYIIASFVALGFIGDFVESIGDDIEDAKVWHLIVAIIFLPITILAILISVVGVGLMELFCWCKIKKPMKWLHKPVFKKKE